MLEYFTSERHLTGMTDVCSPEYLYMSHKSPVQFGSTYEIKRYLKRVNLSGLKGYLRDLDEYAKRIQLGTYQGVAHRKEYSYTLYPHKSFSSVI